MLFARCATCLYAYSLFNAACCSRFKSASVCGEKTTGVGDGEAFEFGGAMGVCCASTRRAQKNNESRSRQITRNRFFKRGGGYFSLLNSISSPKSSGFLFSWNRCS